MRYQGKVVSWIVDICGQKDWIFRDQDWLPKIEALYFKAKLPLNIEEDYKMEPFKIDDIGEWILDSNNWINGNWHSWCGLFRGQSYWIDITVVVSDF